MRRRRRASNFYSDFGPQRQTRPIHTKDGIKARSQKGAFAKNWWATRWIDAMERLVDPRRLTRGRNYAREGQVLSIEEAPEGITARVQGSRPRPYQVSIEVAHLSDEQWEKVVDVLAEQALFTAQLLAGEMPPDIEQAFTASGVSLFPARRGDLVTACSCPDSANPCKHVAATHYILGERFDEDPFLLFRLRGRTQEEILQALRLRRAGEDLDAEDVEDEEPEPAEQLERVLEDENGVRRFWELGQSLEGFSVSIHPPVVEMPILKRLGDPSFVPPPGLQALLSKALYEISQAALNAAFKEKPG